MNLNKLLVCGFASGLCIRNDFRLHYGNKRYINIPPPLIFGCIGFMGIICSPLIIANVINGTSIDKMIDKISDNYDFNIERCHQFDDTDNKYAFPSILILHVNKKK